MVGAEAEVDVEAVEHEASVMEAEEQDRDGARGRATSDRVGLALRKPLLAATFAHLHRIDVLEVIAEDYLSASQAERRGLRMVARRRARPPWSPTADRCDTRRTRSQYGSGRARGWRRTFIGECRYALEPTR